MAAPAIAAGVMKLDGVRQMFGWQWELVFQAFFTFWCGIIILAFLPRGPSVAWFLSPGERSWLSGNMQKLRGVAEEKAPCRGDWTGAHTLLTLAWHCHFCDEM